MRECHTPVQDSDGLHAKNKNTLSPLIVWSSKHLMCVSSQLHVGGDGVDFKDTAIEVINLGICLPQNKKKAIILTDPTYRQR